MIRNIVVIDEMETAPVRGRVVMARDPTRGQRGNIALLVTVTGV
jgi:hypothetical protein